MIGVMDWRPNHEPDDDFAGVMNRIRTLRLYGAAESHIHDVLEQSGMTAEQAHWWMRAERYLERVHGE